MPPVTDLYEGAAQKGRSLPRPKGIPPFHGIQYECTESSLRQQARRAAQKDLPAIAQGTQLRESSDQRDGVTLTSVILSFDCGSQAALARPLATSISYDASMPSRARYAARPVGSSKSRTWPSHRTW